jgi:hypothetical protein
MIWLGLFHLACFAIFLELADRAPIIEDMDKPMIGGRSFKERANESVDREAA